MDVQHLKANGEKYSSVFYVDSAKRDRAFFASPSRYEVTFNEPFRNVFSIQVLDASIPRTHYNVDAYNNEFCYIIGTTETSLQLPVGDYTDVEIIDEMNQRLNGRIVMAFLSSPSERRKQFVFRSTDPFTIKPFKTTLRNLLGFDQGISTSIDSLNDPEYFIRHELDNINPSSGFDVPVTQQELVFYQQFVANATGFVDSLRLQIKLNDVDLISVNDFTLNARVMLGTTVVAEGSTTALELQTSVVIEDWVSNAALQQGLVYYFILNTSDVTYANYDITVDVVSSEIQQLYVVKGVQVGNGPDTLFVPENKINHYALADGTTVEERYFGITANDLDVTMSLAFNLTISEHMHSIVPPGIYNLLGDRYIVLRCPEIENHIMSSIKSFNTINPDTNQPEVRQYETGIAKFKMSVVGFREERFDFNILPPQEFHPIGKLTSLTFSFENQDGRLYDFKGVNHTLSLSVNFYKLKNNSFLNTIISNAPRQETREESDEEQGGYGASPQRTYVQELYDTQDQYDQSWQSPFSYDGA